MQAIAEKLPEIDFGRMVLEKAIKNTGIESRQSTDSYIGEMQDVGWIEKLRDGRYRVAPRAREAGEIKIYVHPALRLPEVREKINAALKGIHYHTIEEV
jgi:predicted transcriptional regulator of viral defense system